MLRKNSKLKGVHLPIHLDTTVDKFAKSKCPRGKLYEVKSIEV